MNTSELFTLKRREAAYGFLRFLCVIVIPTLILIIAIMATSQEQKTTDRVSRNQLITVSIN